MEFHPRYLIQIIYCRIVLLVKLVKELINKIYSYIQNRRMKINREIQF